MLATVEDRSISLVARSPRLDLLAVEVVVTLPTFRRPEHLARTLESLRAQETGRSFAVIVIENDSGTRAGAEIARPLFESGLIRGMVIVAHQRGNCAAYNAGWRTAIEHFQSFRSILVIDDDELADRHWLERMCRTAEKLDADIVGGPQRPVFEQAVAVHRTASAANGDRWRAHPVFQPPYGRTGIVPALYSSGNLLIARRVLEAMPAPFLDLRFNFMGGGDSDFLSRAVQAGFKLAWCAEATVDETIPVRRLERDWIVARSLRNGVISTLVERRRRAGTALASARVFAKSLALLAASPFRAAARLAASRSLLIGLYPVHVAFGRVMADFGYANEQYREPEKN